MNRGGDYLDDEEYEEKEPQGRVIEAHYTCSECGFTSSDKPLVDNHSCETQENGGYCIDFPACGHEAGDCNGKKYGSTESILRTQRMLEERGYADYEIDDYFDRMR